MIPHNLFALIALAVPSSNPAVNEARLSNYGGESTAAHEDGRC